MRNTDADWNAIANSEPYFGVLSNERFLAKNLNEGALSEFFNTGEIDVQHIFGVLSLLNGDFKPETALDFGCGVGRLLAPICRRTRKAYGVDIAESMLELSKSNLGKMGLSNFVLTSSIPDVSVDWINSWIVFQHIPPDRGYGIMQELWQRLNPGGGLSIQFTIYRDARHLHEIMRDVAACAFDGNEVRMYEQTPISDVGSMTMYDYDFSKVLAHLKLNDGQRFISEHTDHAGCHGMRLYIIKP